VNADRVENDLADCPGGHEDDSGINDSTQRRQMPFCPGERSGQSGEQRHIPDRIDRRPKSRKILADLDQKRRHMSERVFYPDTDDVSSTSKRVSVASRERTHEMIFLIRAFLSRHSFSVGGSFIRTADQTRRKVGDPQVNESVLRALCVLISSPRSVACQRA
jgi:hypothetical protein